MSAINLTIEANTDNLDKVLSFVDQRLEELDCSMKVQMQIDETVLVNSGAACIHAAVLSASVCCSMVHPTRAIAPRYRTIGLLLGALQARDYRCHAKGEHDGVVDLAEADHRVGYDVGGNDEIERYDGERDDALRAVGEAVVAVHGRSFQTGMNIASAGLYPASGQQWPQKR